MLGTMIGVFCAWRGTWVDTVLMRISDVFLAFPGLVFALAVAAALGGGVPVSYTHLDVYKRQE